MEKTKKYHIEHEGEKIRLVYDIYDLETKTQEEFFLNVNEDNLESTLERISSKHSNYMLHYKPEEINEIRNDIHRAFQDMEATQDVNIANSVDEAQDFNPNPNSVIRLKPEEDDRDVISVSEDLDSKFDQFKGKDLDLDEEIEMLHSREELPEEFQKKQFGNSTPTPESSINGLGDNYIRWIEQQLRSNVVLEYVLDGCNFSDILEIFKPDIPRFFGRKRVKLQLLNLYLRAVKIASAINYVNIITGTQNPMLSAAVKLDSVGYRDLFIGLQTEMRLKEERRKLGQGNGS